MENREVVGVLTFKGPVKEIAKGFYSMGLKLDDSKEWHNIVGHTMSEISAILGDVPLNTKVKLVEKQNKGYWNVTKIEKVKTEEQKTIQLPPQKIEVKEDFLSCLEKAKQIVRKFFKDPYGEKTYLEPNIEANMILRIAIALYSKPRQKFSEEIL